MRLVLLVVAMNLVNGASTAAFAQPKAELGGGLVAVGIENGGEYWGDGLKNTGGMVRVTVPFSPRFAVEFVTTYGRRDLGRPYAIAIEGAGVHRSETLTQIAVRQSLRSPGQPDSLHIFAIYGVSGFFGTTTYDAGLVRGNPGSYTYSVPAQRRTESSGFEFLTLGLAVQKDLTRRYAIRGEAQVLAFLLFPPVGANASLTMVVRFGG